jgi:hypothetical protein
MQKLTQWQICEQESADQTETRKFEEGTQRVS